MLALTDHLGQEVLSADGTRLGRLRDLAVRLGDPYPPVTSLRVGVARHDLRRVAWEAVASFERAAVQLSSAGEEALSAEGPSDELPLAEQLLDAQIVDLAGKRVVRVGDVQLAREGTDLRLVAVEVGLAALARRIGLGRLAGRMRTEAVDWRDLHLTSKAGSKLQLETAADRLRRLGPADLAELVAGLPPARAADMLRAADPATAAGALSVGRPQLGAQIVGQLDPAEAAPIVAEMPADDAVAALRHVSKGELEGLLAAVPSHRAAKLRRLLAYPVTTAGGLMTLDVRTAAPDEPLERVRRRLADDPPPVEGLMTVFVVDGDGRLQGALHPSALLADQAKPVWVPAVREDTPVQDVVDLFAVHDVLALPVLGSEGRLLGAVAVDDVLEELLAERLPGGHRFPQRLRRRRAQT